jgi:hypothetical protein
MFITFTTKHMPLDHIRCRENPEIYARNISQLNSYKVAWTFKEHGYMFRLLRAIFRLRLKRRNM